MSRTKLFLAWYTREGYPTMYAAAIDKEGLYETFEGWRSGAMKTRRMLRRQGADVERLVVDADELVAWCVSEKRPLDGSARAAFVALKGSQLRSGG